MRSNLLRHAWVLVLLLPLAACGGGGSASSGSGTTPSGGGPPAPAPNVVPVSANLGVENNYVNGLFVTVTVCVPGTTNCTAVNDVLVDTGSYGLRLLKSAIGNLPLPQNNAPDGNPLGECAQFAASFDWGPVAEANVEIGGETATDVPVQIMGDSSFAGVPSGCSSSGMQETDTQQDLGANGILGVGVFQQDCGSACTPQSTTIAPYYFSCPSSGCTVTSLPLDNQVQNPVALFPVDNNGELIQLPSVPSNGSPSVSGSMIFGLGTESNNSLTSQTVLDVDGYGTFETEFDGQTYSSSSCTGCGSVLDTGSNAIFFLDSKTLSMPACPGQASAFYCPAAQPPPYDVTNVAGDGTTSVTGSFSVANAQTLFDSGNGAFNNLAGPNANSFDFGLPFFYGRTIAIGLTGGDNGGPFFAY